MDSGPKLQGYGIEGGKNPVCQGYSIISVVLRLYIGLSGDKNLALLVYAFP